MCAEYLITLVVLNKNLGFKSSIYQKEIKKQNFKTDTTFSSVLKACFQSQTFQQ
jgi:hypothetical protein